MLGMPQSEDGERASEKQLIVEAGMTGSKIDAGIQYAKKKDIPGFPGYFASEDGYIFSNRTGQLKQLTARVHKGYLHVHVKYGYGRQTVKKKPVHQLVLMAFVGEKPNKTSLTRHLNGNALDNRLLNLAWGSPKENTKDSMRHGTAACLRCGESAIATRLSDALVLEIEWRVHSGESKSLLAREFGISAKHVSDIGCQRTRQYLWP